jgi:hypothetical protein
MKYKPVLIRNFVKNRWKKSTAKIKVVEFDLKTFETLRYYYIIDLLLKNPYKVAILTVFPQNVNYKR